MTAAGPRRAAGGHGVGDGELDRRVAERELDPGAARSVTGRVRERFLEDPVGGLVGGAAGRSRRAGGVERHREPRRRVVRDQRVERGQPGRSVDGLVRRALAQGADDLVDLLDRLPGQLLDRLQGQQRAVRVLVVAQPGGAGADRDHADRVAGGVVQIAGDPGAFLGDGEQPLALGLPLGAQGALL